MKATVWRMRHTNPDGAGLPDDVFAVVDTDPPRLVQFAGEATDTTGDPYERAVRITREREPVMVIVGGPSLVEYDHYVGMPDTVLVLRLWDAVRDLPGW